MSAPDDPYREPIRETYEDLTRWQVRVQTAAERPEPGSALAVDDRVFGPHPISEVARLSLAAAGEHLRLARDAIEADQGYPTAHFTVLRGALVGAAQAVWILAPDDRIDRQDRGLTVIAEMYDQLGKHNTMLATFNLTAKQRQDLADHDAWLAERVKGLNAVRRNTWRLNLTDEVIAKALDHTFADEERRESGRQLWRQMSADAHVLGWSVFQRSTMGPVDRRTGLSEGQAGGSLRTIAQPFIASHLLLKEGWSLFDRRCEAPAGP